MAELSKPIAKKSLLKEAVVGLLMFLSFVGLWFLFRFAFKVPDDVSVTSLATWSAIIKYLYPLIGLFLVVIFFGLATILIRQFWIFLVYVFLACFLFPFFFEFHLAYLFISLFLLIALLLLYPRARREMKQRVKIQTTKLLAATIPWLLTILALVTTSVYYFSTAAKAAEKGLQIPESVTDTLATPFIGPSSTQPKPTDQFFDLWLSRDEYFQSRDEQENLSSTPPLNFDLLFPSRSDENTFSSTINGSVQQIVNNQINLFIEPYQKYFPLIFAILFFTGLRFILIFIGWLAYPFAWAIFQLLLVTKFIKITLVKEPVERLIL